jgi:hypothetical protein
MYRKYSYLLLEILIGFSILSMCVLPLARNPYFFFQTELKSLEQIELCRLAEHHLADVMHKLYINEIPWEKVSKLEESKSLISQVQENKKNELDNGLLSKVPFQIHIWSIKKKVDKNNDEYHLVNIDVSFFPHWKKHNKKKPQVFSYKVLLKKENSTSL